MQSNFCFFQEVLATTRNLINNAFCEHANSLPLIELKIRFDKRSDFERHFNNEPIQCASNNSKIDDLLGAYFPIEAKIELYIDAIFSFSNKFDYDYQAILQIVLLHEYSHHLFYQKYKAVKKCVFQHPIGEILLVENVAQLYTYYILHANCDLYLDTFNIMSEELLKSEKKAKYFPYSLHILLKECFGNIQGISADLVDKIIELDIKTDDDYKTKVLNSLLEKHINISPEKFDRLAEFCFVTNYLKDKYLYLNNFLF